MPAAPAGYLAVEDTSPDGRVRVRLEGRGDPCTFTVAGSTEPRGGSGDTGRDFSPSGVDKGWCAYAFSKPDAGWDVSGAGTSGCRKMHSRPAALAGLALGLLTESDVAVEMLVCDAATGLW